MKSCTVEGCQREYRARGLCATHYAAMRRAGAPRVFETNGGPCTVEGCNQIATKRRMCDKHYRRIQRKGTLEVTVFRGDTDKRFWSKVKKTPRCWLWTGYRDPRGYGKFSADGVMGNAHRFAYEHFVGPIPTGLHVDHLCRNPSCVRPDHLEPVTPRENAMRGVSFSAVNAQKTQCPRGHPLSGANLYVEPSTQGRLCRTCRRQANRERERVKRQALRAAKV